MYIRNFMPQDLARVYEIEVNSFNDPYDINMLKGLADIGAGFLVAVEDEVVVGYILFWLKEENLGHIIAVAVDEKYRCQHIATKLLIMAVNVLHNCNVPKITLEVRASNVIAVNFYKKFGFEIDRKVPKYYNDGEDAFIMFLENFQNNS